MKHCADVHRALMEGRDPGLPELAAHLEHCEACRVLASEGGALGHALMEAREAEADDEPDYRALLEGVEAAVERERGPAAWLRSRATPVRLGIALASVVVLAVGSYLVWGRTRLHSYPVDRLIIVIGTLVPALVAAAALGLRPLHKPPLPRLQAWALAGLAAGLPIGLALWPHTSGAGPLAVHGLGSDAAQCFALGSAMAVAVLLLWRALRRASGSAERTVLGAAVAGLAGNLALQCRCPATEPLHLLWGHAGVAIVLLFGGALWAAVAARLGRA